MDNEILYELGIKAKNGDSLAMLKIIDKKKSLIKKMANGDEDCYQYIILKLIEGIKNYEF